MSRSNDPGHYFQTTDALATTERKAAKSQNKHGDPIKLSSKVLAAIPDPFAENAIYVAEAVGEIKRVDLEVCKKVCPVSPRRDADSTMPQQSRKVTKIFDQSAAPLTCLTICPLTKTLFTGSWDKLIYAIPLDDPSNIRKFSGHTDFLKCLLTTSLNGKPILISGSADTSIIIWDSIFGHQLHKLKGHTKALTDLTLDPLTSPDEQHLALFSSSSDRSIRRWTLSQTSASEHLPEEPILAHETSVYRLHWDTDSDLWTASADKSARHLVRSRKWESDTILSHPDFVRDVLVFEDLGLVVTACRDEEVRVWESGSGKLVCTYSGHFEEVTGLVRVEGMKRKVASVSIDGTVRVWSLERGDMARFEEERRKEGNGEDGEEEKKGKVGGMLTAEEEAELAELMGSDDDE